MRDNRTLTIKRKDLDYVEDFLLTETEQEREVEDFWNAAGISNPRNHLQSHYKCD